MVKPDAPALLRKTFLAPRWEPEFVSLSGNTDCYQPSSGH
jgi:DNA repair photolyase